MSFHDKFFIKYVFHFYNYENTYMYYIVNKEGSEKHVFCETISLKKYAKVSFFLYNFIRISKCCFFRKPAYLLMSDSWLSDIPN